MRLTAILPAAGNRLLLAEFMARIKLIGGERRRDSEGRKSKKCEFHNGRSLRLIGVPINAGIDQHLDWVDVAMVPTEYGGGPAMRPPRL